MESLGKQAPKTWSTLPRVLPTSPPSFNGQNPEGSIRVEHIMVSRRFLSTRWQPMLSYGSVQALVALLVAKSSAYSTKRIRRRVTTINTPGSRLADKPSSQEWRKRKNAKLYQELGANQVQAMDTPVCKPRRKPEILSPAGGWPQLRAAVRNGADAVYFGLDVGLNARARAANFRNDELKDVMTYLHERGVKAYVTLNTLVFDHELFGAQSMQRGIALEALDCLSAAHVDAVIVQDIGLALACRQLHPDLPVHASTQMSVTSAAGARFVHEVLGASRVVLGRELSVDEIAAVSKGAPDVEIEAFVHGALCVSYSGQCFSSEAWGGRSANRGQCAQACRLPYGLVRDGELISLGDSAKYLLSPQDLMALEHVPQLINAGVGCFKVEGRLKSAEYVALTTAAYRDSIDAAWDAIHKDTDADDYDYRRGVAFCGSAAPLLREKTTTHAALAQVFARGQDAEHTGLSPGFLEGSHHQRLVRGQAPKHRGVLAGTVVSVDARHITVELCLSSAAAAVPLCRGVGLVFDSQNTKKGAEIGAEQEEDELGGFVEMLKKDNGREIDSTEGMQEGEHVILRLSAPPGPRREELQSRLASAVAAGDLAWRSHDAKLQGKIRKLRMKGLPSMEVTVAVSGELGELFEVRLTDLRGRTGVGRSDIELAQANRHAMDSGFLDRALKLRPSGKSLDDSDAKGEFWRKGAGFDGGVGINMEQLGPGLFLPLSQLQRARQRATQDLLLQRLQPTPLDPARHKGLIETAMVQSLVLPTLEPPDIWLHTPESTLSVGLSTPKLTVLCRSQEQARAALALDSTMVYEVQLDFLEARGLENVVNDAQQAGKRVAVCLPRVLKPGEDRLAEFYLRLGADAILVRSTGALHELLDLGRHEHASKVGMQKEVSSIPEVVGDFSLNAANAVSAAALLGLPGLQRLTPTHDLNATQICKLARGVGPARAARLEVVAHQHLPIFHTEHCVFCRFLSKGNDYRDCGHPCEKGTLHLRDASGKDHRVVADMGCRNTIFNATAQTAAHDLEAFSAAGIGFLRLELVDEAGSDVGPLVQKYHDALHKSIDADELWDFVSALPDANGRCQGVGRGSLDASGWRERQPQQLRPAAAAGRR